MLKLYLADVSGVSLDCDKSVFSEYRLDKLEKLKPELKKRQSIGVELLLIHAVKSVYPKAEIPLKIECDINSKPFFRSIPLHFSLSHSGNYAACAVSDEKLGLDIESDLIYKPLVAKRFFNIAEQGIIENAEDKNKAFARIWTGKESFAKFLGLGLKGNLGELELYGKAEYKVYHCEYGSLSISLCTALEAQSIEPEIIIL